MQIAGLILICVGVLWAALGTGLLPLLASWFAPRRAASQKAPWTSLEVLIPAHNEKETLPVSIESARWAFAFFQKQVPARQLRIRVGLSNWQGTEAEAAAAGADQVLSILQPGKWRALQELVQSSTADWVALVDAGMTWPENILMLLQHNLDQADVIAINPCYQEQSPKTLQKWIWGFEAGLKDLENAAGGPISLHGATIFYRREPLQKAFAELQGQDWFNDDVVIPLTLRSLFPQSRVVYMKDVHVVDRFPSSVNSEVQRRKRLLFGNIQWIRRFFPQLLKKDPLLATIALRRVFRMMWAWWAALVGLGVLLLFLASASVPEQVAVFAGLLILLTLGAAFHSGRRLLEAFFVSLLFPYYFLSQRGQQLRWK